MMATRKADIEAVTYPAALLPHDAELVLLAMLILDNRRIDHVADTLRPEHFCEPLCGRIYARMIELASLGKPVGPVTLQPYFAADEAFESVGGMKFFAGLLGGASSSSLLIPARDQAAVIVDAASRRMLVDKAGDIARQAADPDRSLADLVGDVDDALSAAVEKTQPARTYTGAQAFDVALAEIEAEAAGTAPAGLAVRGFDDWNHLTGNMRRGEVIVLAGRPSMGKTATALSTTLAAARAGLGTLFVSLEMSVPELMKRAMADLIFEHGTSASFENVKRGKFTAFDRERLADARAQLEAWPLEFTQESGLRIGRLSMLLRRFKRRMAARGASLDVVFIDYLGLVKGDTRAAKRYEEVSEVSRAMKQLATELGIAIVLLAQLNREVEKREDKRPQLSDLRDSGEIEQDADVVMFVYREQYYLERAEPDRANDKKYEAWDLAMRACRDRVELIVAKARNGRIGKRNCHFFAEHQAVRGSKFFEDIGR